MSLKSPVRLAHVVDTDNSQTVINVERRIKKRRYRAEREGVVLHNYSCFAKCKAPANQTDFCRHAEHMINQ